MAQTYTDDTYASNHVGTTDLQNIENNFAALKSSFSGTAAPSNVVGGMPWHDSTARKVRNYANTSWLVSLLGDGSQRMWVYRNTTCEGWLIYTSIGDVVLGVNGGSQAYNVNGGSLAGSWTVEGLTHAHTHTNGAHVHQWYDRMDVDNDDRTFNSGGSAISIVGSGKDRIEISVNTGGVSSGINMDCFTSSVGGQTTSGASTNAVSSNAVWRPRAAVGTLQYPDLS